MSPVPPISGSSPYVSALRGLDRSTERLNDAADRIAATAPLGDTAGDMVDLMQSKRAFQANAAVVRTADETVGTLFDRYL